MWLLVNAGCTEWVCRIFRSQGVSFSYHKFFYWGRAEDLSKSNDNQV